MEKEKAREMLREIALYGNTMMTKHCRSRMKERNVSIDDIMNVMIWGSVDDIQKTSSDEWKLTVNGKDTDGEKLTCIVVLITATNSLCITIF